MEATEEHLSIYRTAVQYAFDNGIHELIKAREKEYNKYISQPERDHYMAIIDKAIADCINNYQVIQYDGESDLLELVNESKYNEENKKRRPMFILAGAQLYSELPSKFKDHYGLLPYLEEYIIYDLKLHYAGRYLKHNQFIIY